MKPTRTVPEILTQFLEGINQASGSARLLVHHHQDSRFLNLTAILEAVHRLVVAEVVDPLLEKKSNVTESPDSRSTP